MMFSWGQGKVITVFSIGQTQVTCGRKKEPMAAVNFTLWVKKDERKLAAKDPLPKWPGFERISPGLTLRGKGGGL